MKFASREINVISSKKKKYIRNIIKKKELIANNNLFLYAIEIINEDIINKIPIILSEIIVINERTKTVTYKTMIDFLAVLDHKLFRTIK